MQVLISYSHDSPEHARRVLRLAERLRKDGVDAQLDQYVEGTPSRGWPQWMEDQLDSAEFILMVCTEIYGRRFLGREEPGKGKGATWEGSLITLKLYRDRDTKKFVPVLFNRQDEPFIPTSLSGHTHYLLNSEDNYAKLYDFLIGQAGIVPGELGPLKTRAREAVEPLRFDDVLDISVCQLPLSNIPVRNPFFTGREDVLAQLQEALATRGRAALSGLAGMGKTQVAVEYAYRHLDEYLYSFWTSARPQESLVSG